MQEKFARFESAFIEALIRRVYRRCNLKNFALETGETKNDAYTACLGSVPPIPEEDRKMVCLIELNCRLLSQFMLLRSLKKHQAISTSVLPYCFYWVK